MTTSPQIPALQRVEFDLPGELDRLPELAYNLWWTWNPQAHGLFAATDRQAWDRYRNPIELLRGLDHGHAEELVESETYMEQFGRVLRDLDGYLDPEEPTWFEAERRRRRAPRSGPVAYVSMEYGLHQCLAIYSGGLGVLSGDHCKSASDLGIPLVAVGLLFRRGYFHQTVDFDGVQQHHYPDYDFDRLPIRPALDRRGRELVVEVELPGRSVWAQAWLAQVGRVPLLLLDTDIAQNVAADRSITNVLYVRGRETRLAQEILLGVGGVRALETLGIEPAVWHLNEGHCAFAQVERIRSMASAGDSSLGQALDRTAADTLFTTHTPVPAGNERFDADLVRRHLEALWPDPVAGRWVEDLGIGEEGADGEFNLTALGLRTCSLANAVSELNAEVCNEMWRHLWPEAPAGARGIHAVTNGVHPGTWVGAEIRGLLAARLGENWASGLPSAQEWEEAVSGLSPESVWLAHRAQKDRLARFARRRLVEQYGRHGRSPEELRTASGLLDPDHLTIGFARRFATYKRASLLFGDLERLRALLGAADRPVQIVLAGKAHPADRPGQDLIRQIYQLGHEPELHGRIFFLEDYDMRTGRMLVQGVDVWLNTPLRPMEACGTSGQKAAMNGVLNLSILDGWWPEAYDGTNGWAIDEPRGDAGDEAPESESEATEEELDAALAARDSRDRLRLYELLEQEVVPLYYDHGDAQFPLAWAERMVRAIATVGREFSSARMLRDYHDMAYARLGGTRRPGRKRSSRFTATAVSRS